MSIINHIQLLIWLLVPRIVAKRSAPVFRKPIPWKNQDCNPPSNWDKPPTDESWQPQRTKSWSLPLKWPGNGILNGGKKKVLCQHFINFINFTNKDPEMTRPCHDIHGTHGTSFGGGPMGPSRKCAGHVPIPNVRKARFWTKVASRLDD